MTGIPTNATFYEYRGERLLRRSGGGDYQRVAVDGELTLARFPEALEFSADADDPWVMLPTWAFDAWYQQRVRGRWHGVPVEVVSPVKRGLGRGLVNLDYIGVRPDEALAAGFRGDQYFGWSATVPPAEVEDITVELTRLEISERYRRNGSGER